jgi:hypothetical protein
MYGSDRGATVISQLAVKRVSGTKGFRNYNWGLSPPGTQRAHLTRARKNQLAFLDAFASIGTVRGAAAALGIHRRTHYKWIDTNPDYQAAFEEAREDLRDLIREEVRRRAIDGWGEPIVYRGEIARDSKGRPLTITKYSDRMLELLAKAHLSRVSRQTRNHWRRQRAFGHQCRDGSSAAGKRRWPMIKIVTIRFGG